MATPEGVFSILDTDLYKLTMQCAVHKYFPDTHVTYAFTNRTPDMKLSREAYEWLQQQIDKLSNVTLTAEEETFLNTTCLYLQHGSYMSFLKSFRFQPQDHVKITFQPDSTTSSSPTDKGTIAISVTGLWADTILYEIPLLALTSEAYFRFVERDWSHDNQESRAFDKGRRLIHAGCTFSEFGTRRRRDYHAQELVMAGLSRAHRERPEGSKGGLAGTSNVHFAMKFGTNPIGTVAHEWFMGIAAVGNNYMQATRDALKYWVECFGEGVLAVALTDTFGTRAFLEVFGEEVPESVLVAAVERRIAVEGEVKGLAAGEVQTERNSKKKTWAEAFTGVRQDSGDPKNFVKLMRDFYDSRAGGKTTGTTIVFSDSLNVDRCIDYKKCAEENGFKPSFGIGTFLTNDFYHKSAPDKKSPPLNIVIKLSSANGRPAVKLSDDMGKNTGDENAVTEAKAQLGYKEEEWADEAQRWGK